MVSDCIIEDFILMKIGNILLFVVIVFLIDFFINRVKEDVFLDIIGLGDEDVLIIFEVFGILKDSIINIVDIFVFLVNNDSFLVKFNVVVDEVVQIIDFFIFEVEIFLVIEKNVIIILDIIIVIEEKIIEIDLIFLEDDFNVVFKLIDFDEEKFIIVFEFIIIVERDKDNLEDISLIDEEFTEEINVWIEREIVNEVEKYFVLLSVVEFRYDFIVFVFVATNIKEDLFIMIKEDLFENNRMEFVSKDIEVFLGIIFDLDVLN